MYLEIKKVLLNTKIDSVSVKHADCNGILGLEWGTNLTGDPCPDL